jgi:hypothetical protein
VKAYHVAIWPKPDSPIDGFQTALLKMEMDFAIGYHAPVIDPAVIVRQTLTDLHLLHLMEIKYIKEVEMDLDGLYTDPG